MEMCYDGTLVLPSSYAVMSEEEMTYVEGGGIIEAGVYHGVSFVINMAFNALLGGGTISAIGSIIKAVGKDTLKETIKKALTKWVTARVANMIVGGIFGLIINCLSLSVGGVVATLLDKMDGKQDSQIYFGRIF